MFCLPFSSNEASLFLDSSFAACPFRPVFQVTLDNPSLNKEGVHELDCVGINYVDKVAAAAKFHRKESPSGCSITNPTKNDCYGDYTRSPLALGGHSTFSGIR